MPESAEEVFARIVAAVGEDGRLPLPRSVEWDVFPWEVVDGELVTRVVDAPTGEPESPRWGEAPDKPCPTCAAQGLSAGRLVIWENDHWFVTRTPQPSGLPLVLMLQAREHLDYPELDDDQAAELGRLSVWLCRIVESLPHIGRVHVNRWGDGGSHVHVWFVARTARLPHVLGSLAVEWDDILPPVPDDIWLADAHEVARKLATHDGRALV